jgi:hypothetical protein
MFRCPYYRKNPERGQWFTGGFWGQVKRSSPAGKELTLAPYGNGKGKEAFIQNTMRKLPHFSFKRSMELTRPRLRYSDHMEKTYTFRIS